MLFIQYPKCSTCIKAKKFLESQGIEFESRHIVENPPTKEELTQWIADSNLPIQKFFNTSGSVYRENHYATALKTMSDEEKIEALASNGMLVKRPIFVDGNRVFVGFKEDQLKEWLSSK